MRCVRCKGILRPSTANHIVEWEDKIIIIKNVPAMVCDQCGESYIDDQHARKLEELVDSARLQGMEIVIMNYATIAA